MKFCFWNKSFWLVKNTNFRLRLLLHSDVYVCAFFSFDNFLFGPFCAFEPIAKGNRVRRIIWWSHTKWKPLRQPETNYAHTSRIFSFYKSSLTEATHYIKYLTETHWAKLNLKHCKQHTIWIWPNEYPFAWLVELQIKLGVFCFVLFPISERRNSAFFHMIDQCYLCCFLDRHASHRKDFNLKWSNLCFFSLLFKPTLCVWVWIQNQNVLMHVFKGYINAVWHSLLIYRHEVHKNKVEKAKHVHF